MEMWLHMFAYLLLFSAFTEAKKHTRLYTGRLLDQLAGGAAVSQRSKPI